MRHSLRSFTVLIALLAVFTCASCSSVGVLSTPSTKPEITLQNLSKKQVLDALVAWSAMKGRQVTSTTEYSMSTTGQLDIRPTAMSLWKVSALAQTNYTPVAKDNSVTLYCSRFVTYTEETTASNYGNPKSSLSISTAHEKTEEYNSQSAYEELQAELEDFAKFASSK
jgi:hypothetical protein